MATGGEEHGDIEADNVQTMLRCCSGVEEWLKENQAEQQHLTSSEGCSLSCTEMDWRSTVLTNIVDEKRPEPRHRG